MIPTLKPYWYVPCFIIQQQTCVLRVWNKKIFSAPIGPTWLPHTPKPLGGRVQLSRGSPDQNYARQRNIESDPYYEFKTRNTFRHTTRKTIGPGVGTAHSTYIRIDVGRALQSHRYTHQPACDPMQHCSAKLSPGIRPSASPRTRITGFDW